MKPPDLLWNAAPGGLKPADGNVHVSSVQLSMFLQSGFALELLELDRAAMTELGIMDPENSASWARLRAAVHSGSEFRFGVAIAAPVRSSFGVTGDFR